MEKQIFTLVVGFRDYAKASDIENLVIQKLGEPVQEARRLRQKEAGKELPLTRIFDKRNIVVHSTERDTRVQEEICQIPGVTHCNWVSESTSQQVAA